MEGNFLSSSGFCVAPGTVTRYVTNRASRRESVSNDHKRGLGLLRFITHNADPNRTEARPCDTFRHLRGSVPITPSVAVIIPLMDRSDDLRFSLPRLLHQDFENYTVYLVDNSSIDDFDRVLLECEILGGTNPFESRTRHQGFHPRRSSRLVVIRRPRPDVFSFSISRNCGVRCSASDLLLFVNGDTVFDGPHTLGSIVDDFLCSPD